MNSSLTFARRVFFQITLAIGALGPCLADTPGPGLPKAAAPLFDAISGLTGATGKELETSRTNDRAQMLRGAVFKLLTAPPSDPIELAKGLNLSSGDFLCGPRSVYAQQIVQRAFLLQISGVLQSTSAVEIKDLLTAFSSFFETVEEPKVDQVKPTEIKEKVGESCKKDLKESLAVYFGGSSEERGLAIEAALSLWDVVSGIFKNAVVNTATLVATARRQSVIEEFLKKNDKPIEATATNLLTYLRENLAKERAIAAANFLAAVDKANGVITKSINAASQSECKDPLERVKQKKSPRLINDQGLWPCWRAVWSDDVQAATKDLLEKAALYDSVADLGLESETHAVSVIKRAIASIKSKKPGEFSLAEFMATASQLLNLAKDYETAFSKENRDKISKAVDAVIASLKN